MAYFGVLLIKLYGHKIKLCGSLCLVSETGGRLDPKEGYPNVRTSPKLRGVFLVLEGG